MSEDDYRPSCLSSLTPIHQLRRTGFEQRSISLIHGGLISSYTAGLAAFVRIGSLDRLYANGGYCFQFCFCGIESFGSYTAGTTAVDSIVRRMVSDIRRRRRSEP